MPLGTLLDTGGAQVDHGGGAEATEAASSQQRAPPLPPASALPLPQRARRETRASRAAADAADAARLAQLREKLMAFEQGFKAQFEGRKPGRNGNWFGVPPLVRDLYREYTRLRTAAREQQ